MKFLAFIVFMAIWISACIFVDMVVPDIANSYVMLIGYCAGSLGILTYKYISS